MTVTFIRFVNLILAALLAGTNFGIWMGFNPSNYSPSTYLEQQQQNYGNIYASKHKEYSTNKEPF